MNRTETPRHEPAGMARVIDGARSRIAALATAVVRQDGWFNLVTGLGTSRDKAKSHTFEPSGNPLTDEQLEAMYLEDDMAARVCELLPEEGMRQGFKIRITPNDEEDDEAPESSGSEIEAEDAVAIAERVERAFDKMGGDACITDAAIWSRVFGGGALLVGADDGVSPDKLVLPLNEKNIATIRYISAIDRRHLWPMRWYSNPLDQKFGMPETYLISPQAISPSANMGSARDPRVSGGIEVHESRLVLIDGVRVTLRQRQINVGFGNSVLQRMFEVLQSFNSVWGAATHLVQDTAQAKWKIQGLIDAIAAGDTDALQQRMSMSDLNRSVSRSVLLDAEMEEFERDTMNFTGLPDMLDKFILRLAAACRMPVTMLMGQSPAGMNATGESDRKMFRDTVQAFQKAVLRKPIERLLTLIMLAKDGPTKGVVPDVWCIEFNPLEQMSDLEQAQLRKSIAETDSAYITAQVVTPEEVALSRFPAGGYSAEMTIDLAARAAMLAGDIDTNEVDATKTPADETTKTPAVTPVRALPGQEPAAPAELALPADAQSASPAATLNGAQVSALLAILEAVATKQLPRASGVAAIIASFPVSPEQAESIMGEVGTSFYAEKPEPPPALANGAPGKSPTSAQDVTPKPPRQPAETEPVP